MARRKRKGRGLGGLGRLIRGKDLNADQRRQVLNAFVHRHLDTTSKTDDEWLRKHAFHFTKDGKRLARNRHRAEPDYAADFRGLGSSSEVHSERGRTAITGVHSSIQSALIAAKTDGDCRQANKWLRSATGWYGHAVAHSHAGGTVPDLTLTASSLENARSFVEEFCPSPKRGQLFRRRAGRAAVNGLGRGDGDMKFGLGLGLGIIVTGIVLKRLIPAKPTAPAVAAR